VNLFNIGEFKLHSGSISKFKIDCDALTEKDWEVLACIVADGEIKFGAVVGIPKGGLKFAEALLPYINDDCDRLLIVDDVLTTGKSMKQEFKKHSKFYKHIFGVVVFDRGEYPCPWWVYPIFRKI
jgi:orotate phosphoribosyltransferase